MSQTETPLLPSSPTAPSEIRKQSFLGRYRVIIIAIACFLVFDLGVLVINFYTSFQMGDDAIGINLSGRQRMLSQRMTKALLTVSNASNITGADAEVARKELEFSVNLFDSTLNGFMKGANVEGGDGSIVFLKAAQGSRSPEILDKASRLWETYRKLLDPVIYSSASAEETQQALSFALDNNLRMLGFMNDLTTDLEHVADQRATWLRMVQSTGIILALLNFFFILYKFIGQLRRADMSVAKVINENQQILDTVKEGLFLLTSDYKVGTQISASSNLLFGQQLKPGDDFLELLSHRVLPKTLTDASEYIKLLLAPHVKDQLIQSINPLSEVEVKIINRLGDEEKRYLTFNFSRVLDEKEAISHLLVTVQDVTKNIELKQIIKEHKQSSQKEFNMLLRAIEADPTELLSFVNSAEQTLLHTNSLLRSTSTAKTDKQLVEIINEISRDMHAFKGNAAILGLETIADQAHNFESELKIIKTSSLRGKELGEALLALPIPLGSLLSTVSILKGVIGISHKASFTEASNEENSTATIQFEDSDGPATIQFVDSLSPVTAPINPIDKNMLTRFVAKTAKDFHKQIDLQVDYNEGWKDIPIKTNQIIREIVVQLLRNSIVHGIETPENRLLNKKDPTGLITVSLGKSKDHDSFWRLDINDDGTGLSVLRIKEKLRYIGWFSNQQLEAMDDKQIISQIFKPDFSTANDITIHGGRGAGLDLVKNKIRSLKAGHLKVSTKPEHYTRFSITFAV